MKKIIALLLCVAFVLSVVPYSIVAAEDTQNVGDAVVYLNSASGADANDGTTPDKAVASLAKAIELANTFTDAENVTVVVTGETLLGDSQHCILPKNNVRVTVTSKYGGTDYRDSGACLKTFSKGLSCVYFNGEFAFEYVTINQTKINAIFVMQYNSFKIGGGVKINAVDPTLSSNYPILLVGCNASYDKASTPTTFTNDIEIEINSGTWAYLRSGDRDSTSTFDAEMTISINGGKFLCPATSTNYYTNGNVNSSTGKSSYGPNAKIVMNLNGGEMDSFAGCSYVAEGSGHVNHADITVNINDGFKLTNHFVAVQKTQATFNGRLTINIYGGDFSEVVETRLANLTVANGAMGVVSVNYDPDDNVSAAAFNALKANCRDDSGVIYGVIRADADPVVFVKDGGSGDGTSPHSAKATLEEAYSALDLSKNCTVVICGPYTQSAYFDISKEYEGCVTITSVYGGVDYRVTADAEYIVSANPRFLLYGSTRFDDINVRLNVAYWLFIAQCNELYIGEGFEASLTASTDGSTFAKALGILGGFQNGAGTAADNLNCTDNTDITVLSGDNWVISAYNRQVANGNHSGKATVTVGGDAEVASLYYTSVNKPGVKCGDVEITVKDDATVKSLLASPNNGDALIASSLTVNWLGGNIETVLLENVDSNRVTITNGTTLNYTAEASENTQFSTISTAFDVSSLITAPPVDEDPDDGITASGTCGADGDNLTWTLYDTGELTISGTGAMKSYTAGSAPWKAYCSVITEITVANEVTGIGAYAFADCDQVNRVAVSDNVTSIGNNAFFDSTAIKASHGSVAKKYALENGHKFLADDLKLNSASLTLYNNIAVNYKVKKADFDAAGYTDPYIKIVMNGKTTVIKEYAVDEDNYIFTFRNLSPQFMNDEMNTTVYGKLNGTEYEGDVLTYSIADYCYRQLAKLSDAKLLTLIVDLLNYGAEAQRYVDYKADNLVTAKLTDEQAAYATQVTPDITDRHTFIGEETSAAIWKAVSISLKHNVSVLMKFTATDINGVFVKIEMNGREYRINKFDVDEKGRFVAKFDSFNATSFRDDIKATVCDANGDALSNTLVYSVETYAARKLDDEGLSDIVKAIMKYGDAACDYNNDHNSSVDDGITSGAGYFIKANSLALAGKTFGTIHGELAAMSEIDGDLDSIWYFDRQTDGTYLIRNAVCGYYLSVNNNSKDEGAEISLYSATANHGQHWRVIVTGNGYLLQCVETGGYLGSALQVTGKSSATVWTLQYAVSADTVLPQVLPLKGSINAPASCPEIIKYNGVYYNINMTGGMKIKSSTDLITWKNVTTVFEEKPAWITEELGYDSIWAPGYYTVGGKLRIYYSVSSSGSRNSLIGLVDCETPISGFADRGMVIRSYKESPNTTPYNCIDPNIFEDTDGKVYLVWGSYAEGIYMQRIDPETGLLHKTDTTQYRLADAPDFMEAPYLVKHGDYYYLFVAMGSLNKTADYYWAVGRSENLTGPYLDKNGNKMLSGYTSALTEWKDGVQGVGHAQPFCDDDGQWYMVSESWEYRNGDDTSPIKLHISTIVWNEAGWPVTALSTDLLNELAEK